MEQEAPATKVMFRLVEQDGGKAADDNPGIFLLSRRSPLAAALIGRAVGEIVRYQTPDGALQKVKIERATPWTKTA
ncbi:MAG: GreA/GreB family elongation factor [Candidatus Wildermuthbacteria bacterium]|nr:GreA/GreB family elongation factor [Candidatus Wildermuthbacteria bacterium]